MIFDTRALERFARGLERFEKEIPERASSELIRQVREFAEAGRAPDGTAWITLSTEYAKRKMKKVGNQKPNKRVTGAFLGSVKNRDGIVTYSDSYAGQGAGLERLRISFEPAPATALHVERTLMNAFDTL